MSLFLGIWRGAALPKNGAPLCSSSDAVSRELDGSGSARVRLGYYDVAVLLGSCLYLSINVFALSGRPFLLGEDQALFWANAQRLLHGELIYRDFLEFTPPGADLVYLGLFSLFGSRIWVTNLAVMLLGMGLGWVCFRIARHILSPALAALATALLLITDYGKLLSGTHHWFSVLAVLGAVAVVLEGRATRGARVWSSHEELPTPVASLAIAGALLGLASFFTQTRGVIAAAGIAAYLTWERFQTQRSWTDWLSRQLSLLLPLVATWALCSAYFIARVGFSRLWYFQVTYVRRYVVVGVNGLSIRSPEILAWLKTLNGYVFLLVFITIPLVYAISIWRCRRSSSAAAHRAGVMLLACVGAAMYLEVAQSPNMIRLYCVAVPGVILAVWLLTVTVSSPLRHYTTVLVWVGLIGLAAHQIHFRQAQQTALADLPAGRVATVPANAAKLTWLALHTLPGEPLFEARWVDVYLPLLVRNPVFVDQLESGHLSRPELVDLSIRQLQATRVRYIIWAPRLESPSLPFRKFHEFLTAHYRPVTTFADQDEVWEISAR